MFSRIFFNRIPISILYSARLNSSIISSIPLRNNFSSSATAADVSAAAATTPSKNSLKSINAAVKKEKKSKNKTLNEIPSNNQTAATAASPVNTVENQIGSSSGDGNRSESETFTETISSSLNSAMPITAAVDVSAVKPKYRKKSSNSKSTNSNTGKTANAAVLKPTAAGRIEFLRCLVHSLRPTQIHSLIRLIHRIRSNHSNPANKFFYNVAEKIYDSATLLLSAPVEMRNNKLYYIEQLRYYLNELSAEELFLLSKESPISRSKPYVAFKINRIIQSTQLPVQLESSSLLLEEENNNEIHNNNNENNNDNTTKTDDNNTKNENNTEIPLSNELKNESETMANEKVNENNSTNTSDNMISADETVPLPAAASSSLLSVEYTSDTRDSRLSRWFDNPGTSKIYVENLPPDITVEELIECFQRFGPISGGEIFREKLKPMNISNIDVVDENEKKTGARATRMQKVLSDTSSASPAASMLASAAPQPPIENVLSQTYHPHAGHSNCNAHIYFESAQSIKSILTPAAQLFGLVYQLYQLRPAPVHYQTRIELSNISTTISSDSIKSQLTEVLNRSQFFEKFPQGIKKWSSKSAPSHGVIQIEFYSHTAAAHAFRSLYNSQIVSPVIPTPRSIRISWPMIIKSKFQLKLKNTELKPMKEYTNNSGNIQKKKNNNESSE